MIKKILLAGLLVLAAGCGFPQVQDTGTAQAASPASLGWTEESLARMNFAVDWSLETKRNDFVSMTLQGDALYCVTADHTLYSINIDEGTVNWVFTIGEPLTFRPVLYKYRHDPESGIKRFDEILLLSGDRLRVVDKDLGELLWFKNLSFPAASPPAGSETHIHIGSWDDRVYAIMKDAPHGKAWMWLTHGDVIAPGTEYESLYIAGSTDGGIYAFNQVGGELRWKKDTKGPIVSRPVAYQGKLYIASKDFSLYCIDLLESEIDWRFETAAPIVRPPVIIGDTVYVVSEDRVLTAVRRVGTRKRGEKGHPAGGKQWQVRLGRENLDVPSRVQILCRGRETLYVLNERREIVAVDQETGKKSWAFPFAGATFLSTNANDPGSRLEKEVERSGTVFVGYPDGRFYALKEKSEF